MQYNGLYSRMLNDASLLVFRISLELGFHYPFGYEIYVYNLVLARCLFTEAVSFHLREEDIGYLSYFQIYQLCCFLDLVGYWNEIHSFILLTLEYV